MNKIVLGSVAAALTLGLALPAFAQDFGGGYGRMRGGGFEGGRGRGEWHDRGERMHGWDRMHERAFVQPRAYGAYGYNGNAYGYAPAPVYVAPTPVYAPPVYVAPAPAYYGGGPTYYPSAAPVAPRFGISFGFGR